MATSNRKGAAALNPAPTQLTHDRDLTEGFLGITSPEYRREALSIPLVKLIERLDDELYAQAVMMRKARALIDLALENSTDALRIEALLGSLDLPFRKMDDALCEFGGYFEALVVRAKDSGART